MRVLSWSLAFVFVNFLFKKMPFVFNLDFLNERRIILLNIRSEAGQHLGLSLQVSDAPTDMDLTSLIGELITCDFEGGAGKKRVFNGLITHVQFFNKKIHGESSVSLSALSESVKSDMIRRNRVFQTPNATLGDIVNEVKAGMSCNAVIGDCDLNVEVPFSFQYNETDFSFLKRLLSGYGTPILITDAGKEVQIGQFSGGTYSVEEDEILSDSVSGYLMPLQMDESFGSTGDEVGNFQKLVQDFNSSLNRDTASYFSNSAFEFSRDRNKEFQTIQDLHNIAMQSGQRILVTKRSFLQAGQKVSTGEGGTFCVLASEMTYVEDADVLDQKHTLVSANKVVPSFPEKPFWKSELFLATVTKNEGDPDNLGRIQVRFDWEEKQGSSEPNQCWLDVMTPYSGETEELEESYGITMLPEVGEKVLVRFVDSWDDKAIIIGSLRRNVLHESVDTAKFKSIRTPEGTRIDLFADNGREEVRIRAGEKDKHHVEIVTEKGKTEITVQCDDKINILGKDILLEGETITLKSKNATTLESEGATDIKSRSSTTISTDADLSVNASASMTLKSNAGTEVQSSAVVTVKGALIQLN